jgi:hypothetical protein
MKLRLETQPLNYLAVVCNLCNLRIIHNLKLETRNYMLGRVGQ